MTWAPSLLHVGWHQVPKLKVSGALAVEAVCEQLAKIPASTPCQNRLRSFSSQFDPSGMPSDTLDSIVRNLVVYVQRTCARKEKDWQLHGASSDEPNRRSLEMKMPHNVVQKLQGPLHDWDVQLSELGQETGQNVDERMSHSG
ncbi:hypothetical protein M407DRAFT_33503 [Tulasnella calospora MUT 4182]|uniref:Uncharacterized protein n=1 Tax=Tulasnella calospora MUT 4182 TaxID=1051891 RepID=A0A0C3Q2Y3_9AGAM|nr:hypothetical protein M407DRAFT_33503 [Tulasnella calospora MUT 4182]